MEIVNAKRFLGVLVLVLTMFVSAACGRTTTHTESPPVKAVAAVKVQDGSVTGTVDSVSTSYSTEGTVRTAAVSFKGKDDVYVHTTSAYTAELLGLRERCELTVKSPTSDDDLPSITRSTVQRVVCP